MADETTEEILIPKERISELIGIKGRVKNQLEKLGKVKIDINSTEGMVTIVGEDTFSVWNTKQVVEAIGRGFTSNIAQKLFKVENSFELISIKDYAKKSKKSFVRLKGRVIGQNGKSKNIISKYTGTDIVVYGKTVAIIGRTEAVELARKALEMLLTGAQHGTVYRSIMPDEEVEEDDNKS